MAWKVFKKIKQANDWINEKVKPLVVAMVGQEKADRIDKPKNINDVLMGLWEAFKKGAIIGAAVSGYKVPQMNPNYSNSQKPQVDDLIKVTIDQIKKYWVFGVLIAAVLWITKD